MQFTPPSENPAGNGRSVYARIGSTPINDSGHGDDELPPRVSGADSVDGGANDTTKQIDGSDEDMIFDLSLSSSSTGDPTNESVDDSSPMKVDSSVADCSSSSKSIESSIRRTDEELQGDIHRVTLVPESDLLTSLRNAVERQKLQHADVVAGGDAIYLGTTGSVADAEIKQSQNRKHRESMSGSCIAEQATIDFTAAMRSPFLTHDLGSAEVRLRLHSVVPIPGTDFATPPYVRVSVHPGPQTMARTSVLTRKVQGMNISNYKMLPRSSTSYYSQISRSVCGAKVVYEFGASSKVTGNTIDGFPLSDDDNRNEMVVLKSRSSETVRRVAEGHGPPTLRLELVCGRSVGHCDVSLSEVMRRPGHSFRGLQLPVRRRRVAVSKGRSTAAYSKRYPLRRSAGSVSAKEKAPRNAPGKTLLPDLVAHVHVDLACILPEAPQDDARKETLLSDTPTRGSIKVEALGVRAATIPSGGSPRGQLNSEAMLDDHFGLSVELGLEGISQILTVPNDDCTSASVRCGPGRNDEATAHDRGKGTFECACTELEILTLEIIYQDKRGLSAANGRHRRDEARGRGWTRCGRALAIPVSDVDDVLHGRAFWVTMDYPKRRRGSLPLMEKESEIGRRKREMPSRVDIKLRILLSGSDGIDRRAYFAPDGVRHPRAEPGSILRPGAMGSSDSQAKQERCVRSASGGEDAFTPRAHRTPTASDVFGIWSEARATLWLMATKLRTGGEQNVSEFLSGPHKDSVQSGPGVIELDLIAIRRQLLQRAYPSGSARSGQPELIVPWKVLIEMTSDDQASLLLESPEGVTVEARASEKSATLGELGSSDTEGGMWICWPAGVGIRARYALHWTPRQRVLPCALFTIFREQVGVP